MNAGSEGPSRPILAGSRVTLLLLAILLGVNAAVVWGVFQARRGARRLALEDLEWQTRAHARAVEATLATLRGDLLFLARSSPLARAPEALTGRDPVARRWSRLDLEGSLLLFLKAHPPVERLVVRGHGAEVLAAVGRPKGVPDLLPGGPDLPTEPPVDRLSAVWPLGPEGAAEGTLEALIDPAAVLAAAAPGLEGRLALAEAGGEAPGPPGPGLLTAVATIAEEGWSPPVRWTLVRREEVGRLVRSVEALTGRLGTTVAVNVAVLALAFALAAVAFRQVRRVERLRAESEHQARLAELERQVLHNERLASVGRLAAGIAHEINNPLAGMLNYLALLVEDVKAGQTAGAADLGARLREGLDRIAGITRQVLAFAAPGRGPKGPVEVGELLRRNLEFLRPNPAFRLIDLRLSLPPEPVTIEGNATTLNQLVLNLLLNASQAQPAGGEVEVSLARNDRWAHLAVADRGPGLDREALEHAFEPFYSTRGSAGLGLAVCRGIALDHAGSIRAGNRAGGGALFEVDLPLAAAEASP
jgi:signal transduction histidine kinase